MTCRVYYNEWKASRAAWLRSLMAAGKIPAGDVDERSITDVQPDDLKGYGQCHFFAGLGGWPYAFELAEWGDRPVWSGSCPCGPWSVAGQRKAEHDARHLWPAWFRLIRERRPVRVFGEQVTGATGRGWLDKVATDLEAEAYTVGAVVLGAHSVGADHNRPRIYFVADALRDEQRREEPRLRSPARMGRVLQPAPWDTPPERALREFRAVDDGLSYGVEATDAARDAIVPQTAAAFVSVYLELPWSPQQRERI